MLQGCNAKFVSDFVRKKLSYVMLKMLHFLLEAPTNTLEHQFEK